MQNSKVQMLSQIQNLKQKSQNYNKKIKTDLRQRVYQYSIRLVKFIDVLSKDSSSQIIAKQLLRSGTSIGANVIEAHGSHSKRDFANFFTHALKSANETKYWLGLANILAASLMTIRGRT